MLTYTELIKLRDKLINNEIGIELAKEQCWKDLNEGQRSWHTKDWKERRKKFIKEKCDICDSTETFTLPKYKIGKLGLMTKFNLQ